MTCRRNRSANTICSQITNTYLYSNPTNSTTETNSTPYTIQHPYAINNRYPNCDQHILATIPILQPTSPLRRCLDSKVRLGGASKEHTALAVKGLHNSCHIGGTVKQSSSLNRAALPSSGRAGELRLRPADSKSASPSRVLLPRDRHTCLWLRSEASVATRRLKRSFLPKMSRTFYRNPFFHGSSALDRARDTTPPPHLSQHHHRQCIARLAAKAAYSLKFKSNIPFVSNNAHETNVYTSTANKVNTANPRFVFPQQADPDSQSNYTGQSKHIVQFDGMDFEDLLETMKLNKFVFFYIASLNGRSTNTTEKRKLIDDWANRFKIDILCLQETKVNTNKTIESENFTWFFATGIAVDKRANVQNKRFDGKRVSKEEFQSTTEHHGVGIAIHNRLLRTLIDVHPISSISSRIITAKFKSTCNLNIVSTYAPTAVDSEQTKDKYYGSLASKRNS